jgi:hypothetical protein
VIAIVINITWSWLWIIPTAAWLLAIYSSIVDAATFIWRRPERWVENLMKSLIVTAILSATTFACIEQI